MTAGGWTAIMRRDLNVNKVDFNHDIATYKRGFGDLLEEHFLGNHLKSSNLFRDFFSK